MKLPATVLLAVMGWFSISQMLEAAGPSEDVPIGALPMEAVKETLQKTLSPQGRFVILDANGVVRVFDTPQKIAEARAALDALQNAPAIVSFAISFKTGMHQVTRGSTTGPVVSGYEIPVPNSYGGTQVIVGGRGATVVPGTPGNFQNRWVDRGGGQYVNRGYQQGGYVSQGGYVTGTEVTTQETGVEGGVVHSYTGSSIFPKPVIVVVCARANDPAGLHEWAVKNGGAPATEPAWTAARTQILVTPERADDGIVLNLLPQIVAVGADGKPRVFPLKVCAANMLVKRGAPAAADGLPGADADFYRLFLGAQESTEDSLSTVTAAAALRYLPPAPPENKQ